MTTSVKLAAQPQIRGFMSERQQKFRKTFPMYISDLPKYSFLDAKTFKIDGYFVGQNIGSVVLRVRDKTGVYVVKSARDPKVLETEVVFLKQWKKVGVPVLDVLEFVPATKAFPIACAILEYIPKRVTEDRLVSASKQTWASVYKKLGENLARMHRAHGSGFGHVADIKKLKGKFKTFTQEEHSYVDKERKNTLLKQKLISPEDIKLVEKAIAILEDDIQRGTRPSLLHDDAGVHNTFGISNIRFFDPNPCISHPAKDLGLALIWTCLRKDPHEMRDALLAGYRSERPFDDEIVYAAVFLRLLGKWEWWLHRGKTEKRALTWIEKTRRLFDEAKDILQTA